VKPVRYLLLQAAVEHVEASECDDVMFHNRVVLHLLVDQVLRAQGITVTSFILEEVVMDTADFEPFICKLLALQFIKKGRRDEG